MTCRPQRNTLCKNRCGHAQIGNVQLQKWLHPIALVEGEGHSCWTARDALRGRLQNRRDALAADHIEQCESRASRVFTPHVVENVPEQTVVDAFETAVSRD